MIFHWGVENERTEDFSFSKLPVEINFYLYLFDLLFLFTFMCLKPILSEEISGAFLRKKKSL